MPADDARELRWLRSMPYADYLRTPHWHGLRADALADTHETCECCGRAVPAAQLDVHHKEGSYERRGRESLDDLMVVCRDCHHELHPDWEDDRPTDLYWLASLARRNAVDSRRGGREGELEATADPNPWTSDPEFRERQIGEWRDDWSEFADPAQPDHLE